ncbi:MAG: alpha/beta fold hydrolase [Planctomycetaceae bacterium]|nr:alpha/beta fold hydrolase [Planctomycetaceae bacterium]
MTALPPGDRVTAAAGYRRSGFTLLLLVAVCLPMTGCTASRNVELRAQPFNPLVDRFRLTDRRGPKASDRTMQLLRQHSLADKFADDISGQPDRLIGPVVRLHNSNPTPESCFALAELHYIAGMKERTAQANAAASHFLASARYSWEYLFDTHYDQVRNPYDPQFRGVCDLYNGSLENCLRLARNRQLFTAGGRIRFDELASRTQLPVVPRGFRWTAEDFDSFELVSDYDVKGLKNKYRSFGLGVPIIAIREEGAVTTASGSGSQTMSFPATIMLRFDGTRADEVSRRPARFELLNPRESTEIQVAGLAVPVQSDISTPLAYYLDEMAPQKLHNIGLFQVEAAEKLTGIYMMEPYQPGKIPVLMVHGLWSSPMTWMDTFNELQSQPDLRERYQFWFYMYPSGKPFWDSAADLREDLAAINRRYGDAAPNSPLSNMVLVGHSMGGLIARAQVVASGDAWWNSVSRVPFASLKANEDTRGQIRRVYFFEPNRDVHRIVTIGTPHQGSSLSNRFTQQLLRRLIRLPVTTYETARDVITLNPNLLRNPENATPRTSVDSLSPDSPILKVLYESRLPENVPHHNIVGVIRDVPREENTDGVVPYASAHLENVASEIVVQANHTEVHRHPETVAELKRILRLHLEEIDASRSSGLIQQLSRDLPRGPAESSHLNLGSNHRSGTAPGVPPAPRAPAGVPAPAGPLTPAVPSGTVPRSLPAGDPGRPAPPPDELFRLPRVLVP